MSDEQAEGATPPPRTLDPPTPTSRREEAAKWMEILPAPPKPLASQDEIAIAHWMRECAEVGGLAAVEWLWKPSNFPFGAYMRGRSTHLYGEICREIYDRAKRAAEQADIDRRAKDVAAERDLRRSKGWVA